MSCVEMEELRKHIIEWRSHMGDPRARNRMAEICSRADGLPRSKPCTDGPDWIAHGQPRLNRDERPIFIPYLIAIGQSRLKAMNDSNKKRMGINNLIRTQILTLAARVPCRRRQPSCQGADCRHPLPYQSNFRPPNEVKILLFAQNLILNPHMAKSGRKHRHVSLLTSLLCDFGNLRYAYLVGCTLFIYVDK